MQKMVTSKLDVWSMGLLIYQMMAPDWLPNIHFNTNEKVADWTSQLEPDWVLKYPVSPNIPFLVSLLNDMLDPRVECRPTAEEVYRRFIKRLLNIRILLKSKKLIKDLQQ